MVCFAITALQRGWVTNPSLVGTCSVVSYPDPNVRKHYRLQYNANPSATASVGLGTRLHAVMQTARLLSKDL